MQLPPRFRPRIVPSRLVVLGVGTTMVVLCMAGVLALLPGVRARSQLAKQLRTQLGTLGTSWSDPEAPTAAEVERELARLAARAGAIPDVDAIVFIHVESGERFRYEGEQPRPEAALQDAAAWSRLQTGQASTTVMTDRYVIYEPLAIPGRALAMELLVSREAFDHTERERNVSLLVGGLILSTLGGTLLMVRLNRRLEESRRELELVLESTQAPMVMVDSHQRIVFANRPAHLLLGRGGGDRLVGQPLLSLCPSAQTAQFFTSLMLDERPSADELHTTLPGYGQEAVFRGRAVPVYTAVGRSLGTLLVLQNVTLEKRLEDRRVSQTIHELKGMLGEATGFVRQVLGSLPQDDRPENQMYLNLSLEKMHHCYVTVATMVRNIASAFMPEDLDLHRRHHDAGDLARQNMENFRAIVAASPHDPTVRLEVPPQLPTVYCDGDAISRIMMNLLRNALQHCPRGDITMTLAQEGADVLVTVADTGSGIAPEHLPRVFEPHESFRPGGTGMGLSVCRDFVRAHGGDIWAESEGRGRGAAFHFTLPKSRPAIVATDEGVVGHLSIRCAELGYQPVVIEDLLSVVKQVGELHPNFVLLDMDLRDTLTGPSLAYRLKRSESIGRVPLVAVAEDPAVARASLDRYEGLEMDAFLTRDCDADSFASVVQIMAAYWYVAQTA